jgi:hypothetical protein
MLVQRGVDWKRRHDGGGAGGEVRGTGRLLLWIRVCMRHTCARGTCGGGGGGAQPVPTVAASARAPMPTPPPCSRVHPLPHDTRVYVFPDTRVSCRVVSNPTQPGVLVEALEGGRRWRVRWRGGGQGEYRCGEAGDWELAHLEVGWLAVG